MFFYCNFVPGISLNLKIVTMRLPEDPVMLYSFINMKLRDFYPSLDALCEDMNVEKSDIDVFIKLRKTSYYTLMDIKDDLEQVFRQKVDLITLHETMRALFRRKIEQDAIYL